MEALGLGSRLSATGYGLFLVRRFERSVYRVLCKAIITMSDSRNKELGP